MLTLYSASVEGCDSASADADMPLSVGRSWERAYLRPQNMNTMMDSTNAAMASTATMI